MTLGDCAEWFSGGTPNKGTPEFWGGDIPWISSKELHARFIDDAEFKLTDLGVASGSRTVPPEAILLVVRSMALQNGIMVGLTRRTVAFNQDVKGLIPREGIDPHFLYYSLWGNEHRLNALIDEASHGTKRLNTDQLQAFEIDVPDLTEQQRIARVFKTLDDKIENNRLLVSTLEEIVTELFKARFVDFVDCDDFVDSEIGPIPRGWSVGGLSEVARVTMGQSPPSSTYTSDGEAGPVMVQGKGAFGTRFPKREVFCEVPGRLAQAGDVLMTVRAPVGDLNICAEETCLGRGVAGISSSHPAFVESALRAGAARWRAHESGTIYSAVSKKQVEGFPLVIPPPALLARFEQDVMPMQETIATRYGEVETLSELRNTLLSRLVSGSRRVDQWKELAQ